MLTQVTPKNKEFNEYLNNFSSIILDWYKTNKESLEFINHQNFDKTHVSEKYCDDIIKQHTLHKGKPEADYALPLINDNTALEISNELAPLHREMQTFLGTYHCPLAVLYPPGGGISWHNNADAPGYNLLATWSETGDGYFLYRDENNNTAKVQDVPGWQIKMSYFPSYTEDKPPFYHAAYTDCLRISLAWRFLPDDSSAYMWENLKNELDFE